ncbi:WD repeat-containing protein on Y chromosome [Colossoma macropomum]|uniref:WD repeat-containing protein on Y chromosome n=1 Tax=Colossoma macropomum TaxID=42526 RepID=UPI0018652A45|nr:WD repeat-containing protein on Y chromosome [Colossoma macropomum]
MHTAGHIIEAGEKHLILSASRMPLGKKNRPTSAQGKIETQNVPSILTETEPVRGATGHSLLRQTGQRRLSCEVPYTGGSELGDDHTEKSPNPDWLETELLRQKYRRHSFALGDTKLTTQQYNIRYPTSSLSKLKIEQRVSLEHLKKLKQAFEDFEKAGTRSLGLPQFRLIIRKCLGLRDISDAQIHELFMKIDYSGQGSVEWDEFCTYMQLEYTEKEESVIRSKQAAFALPASIKPLSHGEPILRIHPTPDGTIVTVREDGTVNYWSSKLQLRKSKSVFNERPIGRTPKWATDFTIMPQYNKLIIGTGDREIQLYELSSLEPYCQLNSLETVPLKLDYCYTGPDECTIVYGDVQGCVNIILMTSVGETLRLWKKLPKVENVPSIGIDHAVQSPNMTYIRWKVHQDWVTEVKYFKSIPAVASTSNHEASALVIGCILPSTNIEQQMREIKEVCREGKPKKVAFGLGSPQQRAACDQTVFPIYKGVMTFDLCKTHNLLVTGGMDRLIRMWNPYVPGRPTGILKGHSAPIFYLHISTEDSRIFSVSTDNTARIWDIQDQACLFAAHPKASLLHGDLSACLYSSAVKGLYIATDSLALLSLKTKAEPQGCYIMSHKEAVLCCGYSVEFRQVVSCTEGSVIKIWDVDTGNQVFEYGGAHGLSAITCMTFDPKGRRLVTGGRDGCLKIWNFNNGHCLKTLSRENGGAEICDCSYLQVHRNAFIISVGWDRRIDVYLDSPEDTRHVQRPQPSWQDDLRKGHKEDILCIAQCPPYLLATGSYDGEIIVWNLVSGHIQCRFLSPLPPHSDAHLMDRSVLSLVFLRTRALDAAISSAASLLSSGPQGHVHFWNVLNGGKCLTSFKASRLQQQITKLAVTQDERLLFAADHVGYIYVYDIEQCALTLEQKPPETVNFWRAHISSITGLQIIENDQVLLTSSTDCTVRLWSVHGEFIGTFGQPERWSLHAESSWKHPAVPYEVLIDPLSMPSHCTLDGKMTLSEVLSSGSNGDTRTESESPNKVRHPLPSFSDREIEEEINSSFYPEHGKWLRHEIFKHANKTLNHGGPKAYHTLKYFDVVDAPTTCEKPDLSLAGIDPFIASSVDEKPSGI